VVLVSFHIYRRIMGQFDFDPNQNDQMNKTWIRLLSLFCFWNMTNSVGTRKILVLQSMSSPERTKWNLLWFGRFKMPIPPDFDRHANRRQFLFPKKCRNDIAPYYNSCSSMCVQVYKCSAISIHLWSIQFVFIPCIHVV
jgi:hypothetical protein